MEVSPKNLFVRQVTISIRDVLFELIFCCLVQCTIPHALFLQNIVNTSIPSGTLIERGSSFSYTCLEDYQPIIEPGNVECLDDGKFSHQAQCIPRSCKEHPPTIADGRTIFHSTRHDTIARYRCFPGYRMENNHPGKLTCQFGQWLPKQPPRCLPGKCGWRNSTEEIFDARLQSSVPILVHWKMVERMSYWKMNAFHQSLFEMNFVRTSPMLDMDVRLNSNVIQVNHIITIRRVLEELFRLHSPWSIGFNMQSWPMDALGKTTL